MSYPDRRVQYEAALTLGHALPEQPFSDDFKVVPMLANAVRTGGELFAVVVAEDGEDRRALTGALEAMGFTVLAAESSVSMLRPTMAGAVAVDAAVVKSSDIEAVRRAVTELRQAPKTLAAPVVVLGGPESSRMALEYRSDRSVLVTRHVDDDSLKAAVEAAMEDASGGRMTEAQAEEYALLALEALRDIAISDSTVYRIEDAQDALLDALATREGGVRMFVARILSMISGEQAQRELFDAAVGATAGEQAELLGYVADSIKTHGSMAEPRQVDALLRLIRDASGDVAAAAAQVHGAMNRRPTPQSVELVPKP